MPRHTHSPALRRLLPALATLGLVLLGIVLLGVGLGAAAANADPTDPPTFAIGGTITDTTGAGIGSLEVDLDDSSNNPVSTVSTDSNGVYSFPGLAPGTYTVATSSTEYVAAHASATIADGDATVNLATARIGVIAGTVTGGGAGLSGVRVAAFDSVSGDEYDSDSPTDASGSYSITLPATTGSYTLYFTKSGGDRLAVTSYNFSGGTSGGTGACRLDSGSANVAPLAAGSPVDLAVVLNADPAACSGATPAPAGTPAHHSTQLARTGTTVIATPTPTATVTPTSTPEPSAGTTATVPEEVKPPLTPTDATRDMPAWGWLLVVAAVLAMLGGVGFTVVRHH